jgi:uncharacterized protein YjdB
MRPLRTIVIALLSLATLTCLNDRSAGPGGTAKAVLRVRRVARGGSSCGPAPTIVLTRARVLLKERGKSDSVVAIAGFTSDTATLSLEVPLAGASALFDISVQAIDSTGDTVFRARDTVTVRAGANTTVNWLQLFYAAPDSALVTLALAPRDSSVRFGNTFPMRAGGTVQGGGAFTGAIRLGFVSRDTTIALTSAKGGITIKNNIGTSWIVASTWLGICDSTTVVVLPPVASVDVKPDTADIPRDGTAQFTVTLKDAGGNPLTGRIVTWSTINANASVDTTGLVKGLIANKSSRVIATSEGKADSSGLGILPKPVGKVTVTPKTGNVDVGLTLPLSATAYDSAGAVNNDFPMIWASLNSTLATVNATGVVTGVKAGVVGITATAGGVADTATITVNPVGITSTVVTPNPDTMTSFNDSLQLTAKSYTGTTLTAGTYSWVSRDPTIVTVNTTGLVVAKANGSTYVVATEAGGTKDSAHVFVIQKVASISVTPTPVQRYLGTMQQFTAAGQDARGNAVASVTFTWSVSDPSVASVDATGLATMLAIGIDTVKATVGTVVGKATLTVKSPITVIVVTPSGDTLDALAKTQAFTAVAHDTLGAVMTGINFTWSSSNPSVATVPGTLGTTQTATAVANGVTAIQATAQGVTGAATLYVVQKLVTIVAGPDPTTVGQGGHAQLTARGKDANGFFIPGGIFTWSSDAPTNVSVNAATGVVTGVAVPPASAHITATSGTVNSNPVLVLVDNSVPPRVSWGKDTLAISRGSSNNSLPLYLSKPSAVAVTINVAVKDTFAFFLPTSVSFAAGVTTANANLNGRNAGVTEVFATDPSTVYAGDTSVLLVQAAAKFPWGSVGLNATDYYSTQVLLTDPAPAGGIFLTFSYSPAGVAQISPDPAFVPAGQLASNINVNAIAAGSTTITPGAPGVSGTPSTVAVSAAVLTVTGAPTHVIGAGQEDPANDYVYLPRTTFHPVPVNFASSDTTIATTPPNYVIPIGSNFVYFTQYAPRVGVALQTVSSPGWTSATRNIVVSTPHVGICCTTSINTTTPPRTVTVEAEDSLKTIHYRINPLFVTLTARDTSIVTILDTTVTIGAGQYFNNIGRFQPAGSGGVTWIIASAGGHTVDSMQVTVIAPSLVFGFTTGVIGTDQEQLSWSYVLIPNAVSKAVTVNVVSSDTTIAFTTPLVTIPVGSTVAYFDVRGHRLGSAQIIASAVGYSPDTGTIIVSTPHLTYCCGFNLPNFYPDAVFTEYAVDSLGNSRSVISPLTLSLRSTNLAVVTVDSSTVTIPSGSYFNNHAKVQVKGVGTASIIATAPGYGPDTMPVTIFTPTLSGSLYPNSIGRRQHLGLAATVSTPNARIDSVIVHVANPNPTALGTPDSIKIPKNQNYQLWDYSGLAVGKVTLTFSATGYNPFSSTVTITPPQLRQTGVASSYNTTSPPVTVDVYAEDTIGFSHYTLDTVAVKVVSSDTTVMKVDSTYIHIFKGNVTSTNEILRFVGPGLAKLLFTDSLGNYKPDSTQVVTVSGPSLRIGAGTTLASPLTIGMRQHVGATGNYVYVDNPVTGSPLTINLVSTDPTVATTVATVTIPVGQTIGYFDVTAHDTTGTIQIKLSATGYAPVVSFIQVGQPQFALFTGGTTYTTSPPALIAVYAEDQSGVTRYTTENVVVSLAASNPSVAAPDSSTVTILKDGYYNQNAKLHFFSAGTTTLTASDSRGAFYHYLPFTTATITVSTPTVQINLPVNTPLGLDEVIDSYVYIPNALASDLVVTLGHSSGATSTPGTVTILAGVTTANYRVTAVSKGNDVLTASAPGNLSTNATVAVDSGRILLNGWPASVQVGDSVAVTIYSQDQNGNFRTLGTAVTFTLSSNANIVFDRSGAPVTTLTIPANGQNTPTFYVKGVSAGTGSTLVTGGRFADYSNTLTVTP